MQKQRAKTAKDGRHAGPPARSRKALPPKDRPLTVRDRLTDGRLDFTRSELKVIRELWSNYPAAGLTTIARLARRAGVSDPTVVRLANKLGFEGFVELQEALLAEVENHLSYPLAAMVGQRRDLDPDKLNQTYIGNVIASLAGMQDSILAVDIEAAVNLLTDMRLRISCLGGRFSRFLAALLRTHLKLMRPETTLLDPADSELADRLVDIGRRDVVVIYDFRRYQRNIVRFAIEAKGAGAKIILFTDRWKSPIARNADVVFVVPVETISLLDTMAPALLLTETVTSLVTSRLLTQTRSRMEAMERYRSERRITVGSGTHPAVTPGKPHAGKRRQADKPAADELDI